MAKNGSNQHSMLDGNVEQLSAIERQKSREHWIISGDFADKKSFSFRNIRGKFPAGFSLSYRRSSLEGMTQLLKYNLKMNCWRRCCCCADRRRKISLIKWKLLDEIFLRYWNENVNLRRFMEAKQSNLNAIISGFWVSHEVWWFRRSSQCGTSW